MFTRLFALLAILSAGAFAWLVPKTSDYPSDLADARARVAQGEVRQTACGPIEYREKGTGTPILVVHGAGGGFDQGLDLVASLPGSYRIIAVSRFGYLGSKLPSDGSAEHQSDVYACLLDSLGINRIAVLGASAGAPSAMQFALRHADRTSALVLLVPAAWAPRPNNAPAVSTPSGVSLMSRTILRSDFLYWLSAKVATRTLVRSIVGTPAEVFVTASPEEQQRVRDMLMHIMPISRRGEGLLNDAKVIGALPRYELERLEAPTLAISMADDLYGTYDGARFTADHVPHGRFLGFSSGGHLGVGHQGEIGTAIAAFLNPEGGASTPGPAAQR